ncbi:recombinase family protein [Colidextribacter sp. OB.20]|uniref:recombinase family protein n=1 Tax=Colidextribacter sp. OB.20 TaxID=2304568 RepID=UPI00136CC8AE|nr:recombinase family protein [Colidextribacter sp. OB.20]NBI11904.1 recombinase family protein [Colidextribacter sp. OB.20]
MNAVVYARYSSHKQGEQSIEGQLAAAHKYAGKHGYTIIHEYIDRAQTGRNDDREQFQQMLKDTAKHQFETIIIWKIDRFGRNREEIAFNKYRCKKNGVKVLYTAESIPDTPEGIILEAVLEGMAEYYSVQLATNVKRGMDNVARKGQSVGGTIPLGYRTVDKRLEPDPKTAPLVKQIFEMYAAGSTQKEIVDHLNAEGLRTRKGKPLTVNSIRAVLKNKKYIGIYHYDGKEYPDVNFPALINTETFAKVQQMLVQNRKAPARKWTKAEYLLTGKLFCGLCGHTMVGECGTGKSGAKYCYYNCLEKKRNRTCRKRAVRKGWIENLVLEKAKAVVMSDEMIDFISGKTYRYYIEQNTDTSYTDSLHAELEQVKTAIANLVRAVEAGIFNAATKARMDELEQQQRELETALANAELVSGLRLTQDHIKFFLLQFRQLDFEEQDSQRRIIDIFVNAVFVYDDRVTITFNYSGDNRTITLPEVDAAAGVRGLEVTGHHVGASCISLAPTFFKSQSALIPLSKSVLFKNPAL